MLPIGLLGFVQYLRAQPSAPGTTVLTAEADEVATELTAAERRALRREARKAKTEAAAAVTEPEVTVEVVNPGFNGNGMQNADFGAMPTPVAGGFGMMPMPPFGGFPGFGTMPTTEANGFTGFGTMPNADGNNFDAFGTGVGNF